jgi:hypothetical protein
VSGPSERQENGGIGFAGLLFLVLLVLKLTHVIDWSWWWVTAPLWIPASAVLALLVVGFPIYLLVKRVRNT